MILRSRVLILGVVLCPAIFASSSRSESARSSSYIIQQVRICIDVYHKAEFSQHLYFACTIRGVKTVHFLYHSWPIDTIMCLHIFDYHDEKVAHKSDCD